MAQRMIALDALLSRELLLPTIGVKTMLSNDGYFVDLLSQDDLDAFVQLCQEDGLEVDTFDNRPLKGIDGRMHFHAKVSWKAAHAAWEC